MKSILYFLLAASLLVGSCHKKEASPKPNLCNSSDCEQYYQVWKSIFMRKNNMSADYFEAHIKPFYTGIMNWNSGQSFRVQYEVKIDWMTCKLSDQFIIQTKANESLYPSLDIRRGVLLSETEIERTLEMRAFSSEMNTVKTIEHLAFATESDALMRMKSVSGYKNVKQGSVHFPKDMINSRASGEPSMNGSVELSRKENVCKSIYLNLFTGDCQVIDTQCWVN